MGSYGGAGEVMSLPPYADVHRRNLGPLGPQGVGEGAGASEEEKHAPPGECPGAVRG
jgi:hypothetical protein